VRILGNSGSGKTTFARALAGKLNVAHIELDEVFWAEGWRKRTRDEGRERLDALLHGVAANGWVVDGNWSSMTGDAFAAADALVWLDYPRRTVMARVIWRTLVRGLTRRELWNGNRESLGSLLRRDPEQSIVRWSWTQHAAYRERYAELAAAGVRVVRLSSPREARQWLESVSRTPTNDGTAAPGSDSPTARTP
jgi:adenylate kinase family enzyme